MASASFHAVPIHLQVGSRVVLLSDGITESEDASTEQFTVPHFEQCLTARDPISAVFSAVDRFSAGMPQADDRTMLTIDRVA